VAVNMLTPDKFKKFISHSQFLPTIPAVLFEIMECTEDETSDTSDLKEIILRDQSIATAVLRVANSAYFGQAHKVEDISRAIVVLGFEQVLHISMYVSFSTFTKEAIVSPKFDLERFWMHSIAASEAAKYIARDIEFIPDEVATLIGLVHDIGKVMVHYIYPDDYESVITEAMETKQSLVELEKSRLGFDHAEVGTWLAEKWKFPLRLGSCIQYHHTPELSLEPYRWEAHLAHVSNNLAKSIGIGESGNSYIDLPPSNSGPILSYTAEILTDWKKYLTEKEEQVKSIASSLS